MKNLGYKRPSYAMPECSSKESAKTEYPSIYCNGGPLAEEFKDAQLGDTVTMKFKMKVTSLSINKQKDGDKVTVNLDLLESEKDVGKKDE